MSDYEAAAYTTPNEMAKYLAARRYPFDKIMALVTNEFGRAPHDGVVRFAIDAEARSTRKWAERYISCPLGHRSGSGLNDEARHRDAMTKANARFVAALEGLARP